MTKQEFKLRWESDDNGGGITFNEVAECYVAWGLGSTPRTKCMYRVLFAVLTAAETADAGEYAPSA